ncbi:MAG: glycosyltransferase, partial [Planctomycetota bacterium]
MKVAYLVNQYPKTSHSFIRREIQGVEAAGIEVERFSVRRVSEPLVDPRDVAERERTAVLLDSGAVGLGLALLRTAALSPLRFLKGLKGAWDLQRRTDKGLFKHLIYLAEACVLKQQLVGVAQLHAHFATNPTSVALLCHALGGPPFSFTVHSTQSAETPETNALSLKLARAQFACAVSRHGLGQLQRYSPIERWDQLHVIHCGVDEGFLTTEPTPLPSEPTLVCVARFSPEKGLFSLLEACGLLHTRGVPFLLVLVGD